MSDVGKQNVIGPLLEPFCSPDTELVEPGIHVRSLVETRLFHLLRCRSPSSLNDHNQHYALSRRRPSWSWVRSWL